MTQLLRRYAAYNYWANEKLSTAIGNLTADQTQQEIVSSFTSIHKTLMHVRGAEMAWWLRINHEPQNKELFIFNGTTPQLCEEWMLQSGKWKEWAATVDESIFSEKLTYQNFAGETFTQPIGELLQHVFNHSTYHRGQLVTMLRQVGAETIPGTDFSAFTRL